MGRCLLTALGIVLFSPLLHAAVKSEQDLSFMQLSALQESEGRLITYDRALEQLDQARRHKKISRVRFEQESAELTAFIKDEADFQNAILLKPPSSWSIDLDQVLQDAGEFVENTLPILIRVGGMFLNGLSP